MQRAIRPMHARQGGCLYTTSYGPISGITEATFRLVLTSSIFAFFDIPPSSFISPEATATCPSALTRLRPDQESRRLPLCRHAPSSSLSPCSGSEVSARVSDYLEVLLSRPDQSTSTRPMVGNLPRQRDSPSRPDYLMHMHMRHTYSHTVWPFLSHSPRQRRHHHPHVT
jgi:hypothetical protein